MNYSNILLLATVLILNSCTQECPPITLRHKRLPASQDKGSEFDFERSSHLPKRKVVSAAFKNYRSKIKELPPGWLKKLKSMRVSPKKIAVSSAKAVGRQSQTFFLIILLSAVDIARENVENAKIKKEELNYEQILVHTGKAAEHILTSGEIWTSVLGASVFHFLGNYPLQFFNAWVANLKTREFLKSFIQTGAATLISFIGWEFGGQLYTQAAKLLPNAQDAERAKNLFGLLSGSIMYGLKQKESRDWVLLKQVMTNIYYILFYNNELRELWIFNAWSKRIATGHFATMVGFMAAASTVGSRLSKNFGNKTKLIVGMTFGFFGGLLAIATPEPVKYWITTNIKQLRIYNNYLFKDLNLLGFTNKKRDAIKYIHEVIEAGREELPDNIHFDDDPSALETILSILVEESFYYHTQMKKLKSKVLAAEQAKNTAAERELKEQFEQAKSSFFEKAKLIEVVYEKEIEFLERCLEEYPISLLREENIPEGFETVSKVKIYLEKIRYLDKFVKWFSSSMQTELEAEPIDRGYYPPLHAFYFFGFDEKEAIKATKKLELAGYIE